METVNQSHRIRFDFAKKKVCRFYHQFRLSQSTQQNLNLYLQSGISQTGYPVRVLKPHVLRLWKSIDSAEQDDLGPFGSDLVTGFGGELRRDAVHGQRATLGRGALGGAGHAGVCA